VTKRRIEQGSSSTSTSGIIEPATRMFAMHERTRLFVCRAGFVLACLLPTILTTSAISYFRSDVYMTARREEWVAMFSQRLGMKVEIDELSYPSLSTALLKGVRLRDSETETLVFEAYHIEVTKLDDGSWDLEFDLPTLMTESLPELQQRLHDRVFAELPNSFKEVKCRAKQMPLVGKTQITLNDVELNIFSEDGPAAQCYFRIHNVEMKGPVFAQIRRHRKDGVASSQWDFSTEESEIPCEVLAIFAPRLSILGDRASLKGNANGSMGRHGESLAFVGTLRDVNLGNLSDGRVPVTPRLGSKSREKWLAGGLATIEVRQLHMADGKISAEASLTATQRGFLGSELVEAAVKHFDLEGPTTSDSSSQRKTKPTKYTFGELAFDFVLADGGLQLTGKVKQKPHRNGVIASTLEGTTLLVETEPRWIPQIALVQFIAPPSDQSIPANPEAADLMPYFGPPHRLRPAPGSSRALQSERHSEETLK
jgi:hypothetical protein